MSVFLRRYRNDMLLIAALLLLCGLIFAVRTCRSEKGKYAVVEIDGEIADVFLLSENTEKSYREGEALLNRIRIENGEAAVLEASCPDQICVHHKPVSKAGETIVCLPHRFVITITDQTPQAQKVPDDQKTSGEQKTPGDQKTPGEQKKPDESEEQTDRKGQTGPENPDSRKEAQP
ncbi:MAG: NusG domain II-containing protein [Lachnospiraceae bacterium]|nr:NusG domain II-containing protein [Lachnospiraceae bacterium]